MNMRVVNSCTVLGMDLAYCKHCLPMFVVVPVSGSSDSRHVRHLWKFNGIIILNRFKVVPNYKN